MQEFVRVEDISKKMTDDEYKSFLERQKKKGYNNDATRNEEGEIIDANDQLLKGMMIMNNNKAEL